MNHSFLLLLLITGASSFNVFPMEKGSVKQSDVPTTPLAEVKEETKEKLRLTLLAFCKLGLINPDDITATVLKIPLNQFCSLLNVQLPSDAQWDSKASKEQENAADILNQIIKIWQIEQCIEKNPVEGENLLLDLMFWMRESKGFKGLVEAAKKNDGTYDLETKKAELAEDFKQHCNSAFLVESKLGACIIANAVVEFYPFLLANNQFNKKMSFSINYSRETLLIFKKTLYFLYNWCNPSYENVNKYVENGGSVGILEKNYSEIFATLTIDQLHHLIEIAHFLDINPLMRAIFNSLKSRPFEQIITFIHKLPLNQFSTFCHLIGANTFIAHLITLKIDLCRKNTLYPLTREDKTIIGKCLKCIAHAIPTLETATGFSAYATGHLPKGQNQPFYKRLDLGMQQALKSLLIKDYAFETQFSDNGIAFYSSIIPSKFRHVVQAEHISRNAYLLYSANVTAIGHLFVNNPDFTFRNRQFSATMRGLEAKCISRLTLSDDPHWIMTGDSDGVIKIYKIVGAHDEKPRITIRPLPCWGAVQALGYNGTNIIVAYSSGAIEMFDLKPFEAVAKEARNDEIIVSCTLYGKEREELLGSSSKLVSAISTKPAIFMASDIAVQRKEVTDGSLPQNYCNLIRANDTYIVAAYTNACIKIWNQKKLHREISLPGQEDITVMHLYSSSHLAVGTHAGTVYVINLQNGQIIRTIRAEADNFYRPVSAVATLGVDNQYLAVGYTNGRVCVWDCASKSIEPIKTIIGLTSAIGFYVSPKNKALLEIIYADGKLTYVFLPDCAELEEVLKIIKENGIQDPWE